MILQSEASRFVLSDLLGTHRGRSVQAGLVLRRDFAVFVSLSSRTSPDQGQMSVISNQAASDSWLLTADC